MAKRFTDTAKWSDPWFCELMPLEKLFWIFLTDNCDHAGIWKVNWKLLNFHIPDFEYDPTKFKNRIIEVTQEKWFLPKFISFQYGKLNQRVPAHRSALAILKKERVIKELSNSYVTTKDKDKDKDKDKAVKTLRGGVGEEKIREWFEIAWINYPAARRQGKKVAYKRWHETVHSLEEAKACGRALEKYLKSEDCQKGFIFRASKWFDQWEDWKDDGPRDGAWVSGQEANERADDKSQRSGGLVAVSAMPGSAPDNEPPGDLAAQDESGRGGD